MTTTWVYRKSERYLWTVGFYAPNGDWHPESDHASSEAAAERVHYLNGGRSGMNQQSPGVNSCLHGGKDD